MKIGYGIFVHNVDSTRQAKREKRGLPAWPEFIYGEDEIVVCGGNLRSDFYPLDVFSNIKVAEARKIELENMRSHQYIVVRYFIRKVDIDSGFRVTVQQRYRDKSGKLIEVI